MIIVHSLRHQTGPRLDSNAATIGIGETSSVKQQKTDPVDELFVLSHDVKFWIRFQFDWVFTFYCLSCVCLSVHLSLLVVFSLFVCFPNWFGNEILYRWFLPSIVSTIFPWKLSCVGFSFHFMLIGFIFVFILILL